MLMGGKNSRNSPFHGLIGIVTGRFLRAMTLATRHPGGVDGTRFIVSRPVPGAFRSCDTPGELAKLPGHFELAEVLKWNLRLLE